MSDQSLNNNEYIIYSKCSVFMYAIITAFTLGSTVYYSVGVRAIPSEFGSNDVTVLLKIYCFFMWYITLSRFVILWSRLAIVGRRINLNLWRQYSIAYKFPFKYIDFAYYITYLIELYFVYVFTPIKTTHCAVYGDNKKICTVFYVIVVNNLITTSLILFSFCCACCMCGIYLMGSGIDRRSNIISIIRTNMNAMNAVQPVNVTPSDNACAICLAEPDENDTQWSSLPCGHVFHPACIAHWLSLKQTCPICRDPVGQTTENPV